MQSMVAPPPELIEVRSDERFDEHRLAEWLRGKLAGSDLPLTVRQFGGGPGVGRPRAGCAEFRCATSAGPGLEVV